VIPVLKLTGLLALLLSLDVVDTRQNVSLALQPKSALRIVRLFVR
jgi:hypothetical protein